MTANLRTATPMLHPTREEFHERAKRGNLIPVYREVLADMETPVSAFLKLDSHSEFSFLLESVEQGEALGRYSFLSSDPKILFRCKGQEIRINYGSNLEDFITSKSPLDVLQDFMKRYQAVEDPALPRFTGGAVGYIGYDAVRTLETLPDSNPDDLRLPDLFFMIAETLVIFDHVRRRMILLANAHVRDDANAAYDEAAHQIDLLAARLSMGLPKEDEDAAPEATDAGEAPEFKANFTRDEFEAGVRKCIEYINAGDAFQVVFSQRFQRPVRCKSFDVYRALRAINPSPYNFYLKFGDLRLVGSSPEALCRVQGERALIRPIAGTAPRGKTQEEDEALERKLIADPKERAEHVMLVDLGRNDLGRVSQFGSVKVEDLMIIQRFSHVMHIVSTVTGKLRPGKTGFDAIKATFPHGTLSGAPKIRAMEIIDELENLRRGPYAGCVGYFGFNGNVDTCVTIRTIVIKDGVGYVQAGGGIVADSVPGMEWQESVNKASAVLRAVEMAERGLDL